MKILNFGSLNIDYVYKVDHFVSKGETLSSEALHVYSGGKGLNQSVALGRAGDRISSCRPACGRDSTAGYGSRREGRRRHSVAPGRSCTIAEIGMPRNLAGTSRDRERLKQRPLSLLHLSREVMLLAAPQEMVCGFNETV